jgi:hypothetical protein
MLVRPQASRRSVLSVLGNWLWLLVGYWIFLFGPILGLIILSAGSSHWIDGFMIPPIGAMGKPLPLGFFKWTDAMACKLAQINRRRFLGRRSL